MTVTDSVKAARRCGTPLIVIRTADPSATVERIQASLTPKQKDKTEAPPIIVWDVVRGATGNNESGAKALQEALAAAQMQQMETTNGTEFLSFTKRLPVGALVFMLNIHRFCSGSNEDIGCIQAMWNLRDAFKAAQKCVIGLVPAITLPAELSQDVLVLDEPLPTDEELKTIAEGIFESAQIAKPDAETMERIVDATLGLAAFPAEQSMAMSITKKGMDLAELWDRKRKLISQTPGLSVLKPSVTLDDIGGVSNAKQFMRRVMDGAEPPRCFVFVDEGEKAFAGSSVAGGDTSGVSQGFLMKFLTEMQDENYSGAIFVGFPGSAKSMVAKAAGATAGVPTIQFDLGGMKGGIVGTSEANIRQAFATVKAVSQGRAYFIMTCNGIATLPPELKRRFRDAIFFFDIPTREEKDVIWKLYLKQYAEKLNGLDQTIPDDDKWTGAEISTCVSNAYRFRISLVEAAAYIVPAFNSMGTDKAQKLREEAAGKFVSASYPGPYELPKDPATAAPAVRAARAIALGDD